MLETAMTGTPSTPGDPVAAPNPARSDASVIRIVMPVVLLGFATVFCSLFFMLWPSGNPNNSVETVLHAVRIVQQAQTESTAGLIRAITDVSIYVVVLAGIACLALALMGRRGALLGLMGVGLLGLAYASGMALYTGPMVSVCGYTMIVFGGLIAWVVSGSRNVEPPPDTPAAMTDMQTDVQQEAVIPGPDQALAEESPHPQNDALDEGRGEVADQPDTPNWVS